MVSGKTHTFRNCVLTLCYNIPTGNTLKLQILTTDYTKDSRIKLFLDFSGGEFL